MLIKSKNGPLTKAAKFMPDFAASLMMMPRYVEMILLPED